ncbi:MAG: hypothetical protein QOJ35_3726 [Solirubrobacteraceae bacterium]|jgi:hypothetical protein|nr:hypothetical protein [Solirubrobacteraceae bacterium]
MSTDFTPYLAWSQGSDPDGPAGDGRARLDDTVIMIVDVIAPDDNQMLICEHDPPSERSPTMDRLLAGHDRQDIAALSRWIAAESLVMVEDAELPHWFASVNADLARLDVPEPFDEVLGGRDAARNTLMAITNTPSGPVSDIVRAALRDRVEHARLTVDLREALLAWITASEAVAQSPLSNSALLPLNAEIAADEALRWARRAVLRDLAAWPEGAIRGWLVAAHRWGRAGDPERAAACLAHAGHRNAQADVRLEPRLAAASSADSILDGAPRRIALSDGEHTLGIVGVRVRQTSVRLTPVGDMARAVYVAGIPLDESPEIEGDLSTFAVADLVAMLTFEQPR